MTLLCLFRLKCSHYASGSDHAVLPQLFCAVQSFCYISATQSPSPPSPLAAVQNPWVGLTYVGRTEKVLCYHGISDGPVVVAVACHQDKTRLVDRSSILLLRSQVGGREKLWGM